MNKLIIVFLLQSIALCGADQVFVKYDFSEFWALCNKYNYYGRVSEMSLDLIHAARKGEVGYCTKLIEAGADINAMRQAPLKEAIKGQHVDCVALLIAKRAELNQMACGISGALEKAAAKGNITIVKMLLDAGAHPEDGVGTPLLAAVRHGHLDVAELLIARGACPTRGLGSMGEEPIHTAAACGNNDAIKFLIKHGNNVNAQGSCFETPLHRAARCGHLHTIKLLKELGAQEETTNSWGQTPLDLLVKVIPKNTTNLEHE